MGAAAWLLLDSLLPALPAWARFVLAYGALVVAPGAAFTAGLLRTTDRLTSIVFACTVGLLASPLLAHVLGIAGAFEAFPYVALGLGGAALAWHVRQRRDPRVPVSVPFAAGALVVALAAAGICAVVYAHRLTLTPESVAVTGDYDSFDSTYYAAIAGEVAYTIPPTAPFNAGHMLNYSYYPHLLLGMIHRFADVPLLLIYFGYAWPIFLALAGLCLYVLVAGVSTPWIAAVASLLFLLGSDLSWLIAWFGPPETHLWDYVIWSANTFSPGPETLPFNTFAPAMAVLFAAIIAITQAAETGSRRWIIVAALLIVGVLQYKPFAYADLVAGLAAAAVFPGVATHLRRRYLVVLGCSLVAALPFFYTILRYYEESQSHLAVDLFLMPRLMLDKLTIADEFTAGAARLGLEGGLGTVAITLAATLLFFGLGLGFRLLGLRSLWRGLTGALGPSTRLLAWTTLAGVAIPFVIVTDPYHQTMHFYQVTLFLLPVFVAYGLAGLRPSARWIATALVFAIAVPSTVHYLRRKWNDTERPFAAMTKPEIQMAEHLRGLSRERTVLLHDNPRAPSLLMIQADKRVVLAWERYVPNSRNKRREIERFFRRGVPADAARETLARYGATHLLVDARRHRIHPDVMAWLLPIHAAGPLTLYWVPGPAPVQPGN